MNEMLRLICCISSLGPAADAAPSVTDGKQMVSSAGRRPSERRHRGLRRPFSFVPPQKQSEEGKLHPRNDPTRGLNYNRLKPIPCFKDLCNFKRKKKVMCFKVKFSQLDSFRHFFFTSSSVTAVSIIFLCFCLLMLILVVTQIPLTSFLYFFFSFTVAF